MNTCIYDTMQGITNVLHVWYVRFKFLMTLVFVVVLLHINFWKINLVCEVQ